MSIFGRLYDRFSETSGSDWAFWILVSVIAALAALLLYAIGAYGLQWLTLMVALGGWLLAGACLAIGALLGFLFGIPRSIQEQGSRPANGEEATAKGGASRYGANTNLEQISDWLTKILVGVGLTQIGAMPGHFAALAAYFAPVLAPAPVAGNSAGGSAIALAAILFFLTTGFLYGYLWTRLHLAGELARADLAAVVRELSDAQEQQAQIDATALSLVNQYLSPQTDPTTVAIDKLRDAIRRASPAVKVQVFYLAEALRRDTWRDPATKGVMERTIPIFEALIEGDPDRRFHKNHAQLGFALKDQRSPDLARAESEISRAIEIRGPWSAAGWEIYELNRAICRIRLDPEFRAGQPSTPARRAQILDDVRVARRAVADAHRIPDIEQWLALNRVPADEVKPAA